jgi:hypothetical protein
MAEQRLNDMLVIDGALWQRLPAEPRITFSRELRIIDDDRVAGVMVFKLDVALSLTRNAFTTGEFNLNRLSDCIEHVQAHYPAEDKVFMFENLSVKVDEAFTLSEEADALVTSARKTVADLGKGWSLSPQLMEAANRLKWALSSGKLPEEIAEILADTLPRLGDYPEIERGVRAATERWSLRPTDHAVSVPGI